MLLIQVKLNLVSKLNPKKQKIKIIKFGLIKFVIYFLDKNCSRPRQQPKQINLYLHSWLILMYAFLM